ncbi:E3 ubiquitin-protein ligase XIAP isoform X2 [Micropterus dolomieu]|uniref:E3 ubiquitin-protein ligase XIAP isoform X2 n=1 Tax=Micropterus dolomieu TaxID=147949 RepID=UPI001E8DA09D|nr:E3 ubiquitin-protein ligase XIAP isoform X2 [Micropterus dolomieu]
MPTRNAVQRSQAASINKHSVHQIDPLSSSRPCSIMFDPIDLETDYPEDFSLMNSRLESFRGSSLAQQMSAERLARAGFYFTGQADRVRCFSCQKTVENWCMGDAPVERHKEVSPSCRFLSCTHRTSCIPRSNTTLINGSTYNEEAEDMEYRLRTGEVVDESTYPMAPHMRNEEARLQTFSSWPSTAPVRPRDLAQAGLYYTGESDRVQCFCCNGMLGGWEAGDTAWGEHAKHFPYCFFILGHDVGNIPFHGGVEEEVEMCGSRRDASSYDMRNFEERLGSFAGVQHPVDHERLARAGFYSQGNGDQVLCFRCGGGLKSWQPEEDPWEEHAKYYPGCSFLLAEKGQEFVSSIQLQGPRGNGATSSHQNGFSGELLQSVVAQKAIKIGLEDCHIPESDAAKTQEQDEDPLEKLRKLQMEKQCKICMDRDICIVFIPCGHLVSCKECSESLIKCPICCGAIKQKIKTYIA